MILNIIIHECKRLLAVAALEEYWLKYSLILDLDSWSSGHRQGIFL